MALQGAIVAALKASTAVTAMVAKGLDDSGIHDRVPERAKLPYISFGPAQVTQDDADCITGFEVFLQIDIWSRMPGSPECQRIAAAVREVLHGLDTEHGGLSFEVEHRFTNYLRDPDGLTSHGVMSFRALIDQTAD